MFKCLQIQLWEPVISVAACNNAENVSGNQSAHGWPEHMLITNSRSGSRLAQTTKSGTQKQKPCKMLFLIPSENNKLRKERANDLLGLLTVFSVVCDFVISFYCKFGKPVCFGSITLPVWRTLITESMQRNIPYVVNISPSDELLCSYRQGQTSRLDKIQLWNNLF